MAQLIAGKVRYDFIGADTIPTAGHFTHIASGSGTSGRNVTGRVESARFFRLQVENTRVPLVTDGAPEVTSSAMVFIGHFGVTTNTANVTESGVFDRVAVLAIVPSESNRNSPKIRGSSYGCMLYRTRYRDKAFIPHVQYKTNYTCSQSIYMISIF